jgi:hypothetical protein
MSHTSTRPDGIASAGSATRGAPLPRPHRRPFVVGPAPYHAHDEWRCTALADGVWLSHCPDLRTQLVTDAEETRWALLGLAVESDPDAPMPAERIA